MLVLCRGEGTPLGGRAPPVLRTDIMTAEMLGQDSQGLGSCPLWILTGKTFHV